MKNIEDFKKFKIFIAGPMSGYPNYNFNKFDAYEKFFKINGIDCINPGRISRKFKEVEVNNDINIYNEMVRLQQEAQKTCNAILLLDGWQWSELYAKLKTWHLLVSGFRLINDIAIINRGLKLRKRNFPMFRRYKIKIKENKIFNS
jgi:hypothetical protein